eukprot:1586296-Amphidinium_carterae.1
MGTVRVEQEMWQQPWPMPTVQSFKHFGLVRQLLAPNWGGSSHGCAMRTRDLRRCPARESDMITCIGRVA